MRCMLPYIIRCWLYSIAGSVYREQTSHAPGVRFRSRHILQAKISYIFTIELFITVYFTEKRTEIRLIDQHMWIACTDDDQTPCGLRVLAATKHPSCGLRVLS